LPAVAVGAVRRHIVYPLRSMAIHHRIRFFKNMVAEIDLVRREVPAQRSHRAVRHPRDRRGSVTNTTVCRAAPGHARPFKTIVDAMTLRARVVELFEMADKRGPIRSAAGCWRS
jgi:NADH dehydrogenase FAD-containing subunit